MLVVEPKASRFETAESGVSTNEHLLERISATENRISRLTERLERSLDLVLRQAQNSYFDRSLVKALVDVLAEEGLVNRERLEQAWTERCQTDSTNHTELSEEAEQVVASRKARPQKKRSPKRTRR
jgi:DNA-binding MarR family transcriptional regulator